MHVTVLTMNSDSLWIIQAKQINLNTFEFFVMNLILSHLVILCGSGLYNSKFILISQAKF